MRLLTLLALLLVPGLVRADAAAEAAAALALAKAHQPEAAVNEERTPGGLTYAQAHAKAKAERRDIIIWIGGMTCPPCVAETPDCVHCHVASLDGDDSPRVLVGVYNPTDGKLWCLGYAYACTSGPNGTLARERARVRATFQQPVQYQQPQLAPVYQQPALRSFGGSRSC